MQKIVDFINEKWDLTRRFTPNDEDTLIGLPKPYTVPSIKDRFNEIYYWDTYFTNIGLIISNKVDYARDNTENIAYLINKYGFMPNGNRTYYLNRSQPPFFSFMIRDVYNVTGDKEWLSKMYASACIEYKFWQEKRGTENGLNRYYHTLYCADKQTYTASAEEYCRRLNSEMPEDDDTVYKYAQNNRIVCESGWDCNSRMGHRLFDYNWIDLNSLLFAMEKNMSYFAAELDNAEAELWRVRAEKRRALLNELCWNEKMGMFCDYDFKNGVQSDFVSLASFYPLFVGLATPEQAARTVKLLSKLEMDYGLACCEKRDDLFYLQWDYPHGWAPLHYMTVEGLRKYGFEQDALRIARKYCSTVERNFEETGNIWEHYDTVTGQVSVTKEKSYQITMMGWSAGIYLHCLKSVEGTF